MYKKALRYILNILNKRDYTEYEIKSKLLKKGFDSQTINDVLNYVKEKNFINDRRYAENFVFFKLKAGYGVKKIQYAMKEKGINENLISEFLSKADEAKYGRAVFVKQLQKLSDKKNAREKLYAYMTRRGFKYDTIKELFSSYEKEAR